MNKFAIAVLTAAMTLGSGAALAAQEITAPPTGRRTRAL